MAHQFNFNGTMSFEDSIIVEDLGNTCLEAVDELNYCYYFITRTKLGTTTCVEFGPIDLEDDLLPDETNIHFERFEFSNNAIIKKIGKFLMSKKNMLVKSKKVKIIQVVEKPIEEVLQNGVNIFDYIKEYSDTSNY